MYHFRMNLDDLKTDIEEHKKIVSPENGEIINYTVPFYMLHKKMSSGIFKIEDEKYNLNHSDVDVLVTVLALKDENYTVTPKRLAQKLLFTTGGIAKILKKLEDRKYIIRLDNEYDKRSKLVQLTQEGKDIAEKIFNDLIIYETKCFSSITDEEKEIFQKIIIKMLKEI